MNLIKMRKRLDRINKREVSGPTLRTNSNGGGGALSESVLNKCRKSFRGKVQQEIYRDNSTD